MGFHYAGKSYKPYYAQNGALHEVNSAYYFQANGKLCVYQTIGNKMFYAVNCTVSYDADTTTLTATPIDVTSSYYVFFSSLTDGTGAGVGLRCIDGLSAPNLYIGKNIKASTTYSDKSSLYANATFSIQSRSMPGGIYFDIATNATTQISNAGEMYESSFASDYIDVYSYAGGLGDDTCWEITVASSGSTGNSSAYPIVGETPPFNGMTCCLWVDYVTMAGVHPVSVTMLPVSLAVNGDGTGADLSEHTHTWGVWTSNGDGTHTRTCTTDNSHTQTENCAGGTAYCNEQAVCSVCGASYGSVDSSNHTGGTMVRNAIEATTEDEGYTGDTCCLGCGAVLIYGEKIPKLEPSYYAVNCTVEKNSDASWYATPIDNTQPYYVFFNSLTETNYSDYTGDQATFTMVMNELSVPSVYIGTFTPTLSLDVSSLQGQTMSIRGVGYSGGSYTMMSLYNAVSHVSSSSFATLYAGQSCYVTARMSISYKSYWYVSTNGGAEQQISAPSNKNIPFNDMQVCLYVEPHPNTGTCGTVQLLNLPLEQIAL